MNTTVISAHFGWKWYAAGTIVSLAGFATLLSNVDPWMGNTEPFWSTDFSEGESAFLLPGACIFLAVAFAMSARVKKSIQDGDEPRSIDKIPHYAYMAGFALISISAAVGFFNTFGTDYDNATVSGARALQGIVAIFSLVAIWMNWRATQRIDAAALKPASSGGGGSRSASSSPSSSGTFTTQYQKLGGDANGNSNTTSGIKPEFDF